MAEFAELGEMSERKQREIYYDNLAAWTHKVLTVNGRHQYEESALRQALARAHVLDREGNIRQDRIEKFLQQRGFRGSFPSGEAAWANILEGGS